MAQAAVDLTTRIQAELTLRERRRQAKRLEHDFTKLADQIPAEWRPWLTTLFPDAVTAPMAPHHVEFWEYVWPIELRSAPDPFFGVWSREGGKSTNVELACVALGVRGFRRYIVYVRKTQEAADQSVTNLAEKLESAGIEKFYPQHSRPLISKFGASRGWRRARLRTAGGLTIDAIGLDTGVIRGLKVGDQRPDVVVLDDIDDEDDTPQTTARKRRRITMAILPAAARDTAAIIGIQNLVIPDGIFTTIVDGRADYLTNRHVSGPHPAVRNLKWEWTEDEATGTRIPKITAGEPTWAGQNLDTCNRQMVRWGPSAFLREAQHQVRERAEGLALNFDPAEHYVDMTLAQIRDLVGLGSVFAGIDFQAWRFAFLLFAADEHGVAIRIGEIFSQREELSVRARRIHELCELLHIVNRDRLVVPRVPIWGDSANPQDIMEINAAFKRGWRVPTGRHVVSPLRVVGVGNDAKLRRPAVQRINDKLGERAIRFVRVLPRVNAADDHWLLGYNAGSSGTPMRGSRCIWEMDHWAYKTPIEGKVDLKEDPDDHTADGADMMACGRYALMSWWKPAKPRTDEDTDPFDPKVLQAEMEGRYILGNRRARSKRQTAHTLDED